MPSKEWVKWITRVQNDATNQIEIIADSLTSLGMQLEAATKDFERLNKELAKLRDEVKDA